MSESRALHRQGREYTGLRTSFANPLQLCFHVRRALPALVTLFGQRPPDHVVQRRGA